MVRIGSKPIELLLDIDENVPGTIHGDELRLKQILSNLLSNAIKYTESGHVKLSVNHTMKGDEIRLRFIVEDTGQGMKPEDLARLFSEYTRFNEQANRTTEGTGIGLTITKNLVSMMDGTITAESEYGKGSIFTVEVRQEAVKCEAIGAELSQRLRNFTFSGNKQLASLQIVRALMPYGKVLIVDDVETNLYVAEGLLAPYELTIETAISGFAAIEKVEKGNRYDIIFMDHMMPKMDGMEATKIIRSLGYTNPIVALTANAVAGQSEVFLANGFDDFISKPIDIRQMNFVLNRLIRDKYPTEVVEAARRQNNTVKENIDPKAPPLLNDSRLLKIFIKEASKSLSLLKKIYENLEKKEVEEIKMYTIKAHSMKTALANIGENELSALALKLEHAGNNNDYGIIASETPKFLGLLEALIEKITPDEDKVSNESAALTEEERLYIHKKLISIKEACVVFDKKAAKSIISDLSQKVCPPNIKEILSKISELLLTGDFEKIPALIDETTNNTPTPYKS
jgi:CheY-like chemotaxis protein/anti-sigma regulatory factor (Ser/Thr protein kinase)